MVALLVIDGLRAAWMMSEKMVLWQHEANANANATANANANAYANWEHEEHAAETETPELSGCESWKKQGKLVDRN